MNDRFSTGNQPSARVAETKRWLVCTRAGSALRSRVRRLDGDRCVHCGVDVDFADRFGPAGGVYDLVNRDRAPSARSVFVACRRCNTMREATLSTRRVVELRARRVLRRVGFR